MAAAKRRSWPDLYHHADNDKGNEALCYVIWQCGRNFLAERAFPTSSKFLKGVVAKISS